jgi:hypothetical protein
MALRVAPREALDIKYSPKFFARRPREFSAFGQQSSSAFHGPFRHHRKFLIGRPEG